MADSPKLAFDRDALPLPAKPLIADFAIVHHGPNVADYVCDRPGPAGPVRVVAYVRNLGCPRYETCLGIAETRRWPSFTCDACRRYAKARADAAIHGSYVEASPRWTRTEEVDQRTGINWLKPALEDLLPLRGDAPEEVEPVDVACDLLDEDCDV